VVKQLPAEMLQQCLSVSSIIMEQHYTRCEHTTLSFWIVLHNFFNVLQYTYEVIVFPYCMISTISTPFMSRKTVAIGFLADAYLIFFGLFGECVCIHWFDCCLVSTFTNET
jgi:hypothetical protein